MQAVEYREGQEVVISVETATMTPTQAQYELNRWKTVYEGLTNEEVAEVEEIALGRSLLF